MKGMLVPKLLVVDKSIFHSLCCCEENLCVLMRDYNVVLPHVLAVECLISENQTLDKDPVQLLENFDVAIKAGAKMGYSSAKLIQAEKMTLCPAKSVVDERSTEQFMDSTPKTNADFIEQEAEDCRMSFKPSIKKLLDLAKTFYENLRSQEKLSSKLRKEKDRLLRFEIWVQNTDKYVLTYLEHCISKEFSSHADVSWYTWQRAHLWLVYSIDWMFKKNLPGSSEKNDISNDFYDIEYVAYLSQANGLLTNDKKLQEPLAKAVFPKKEVFIVNSSKEVQGVFDDIIKIIPQSYRIE